MTTTAERLYRMRLCELDLGRNGIDLAGSGVRGLRLLVWLYLDYFQLMLGYDAAPREVIALENRLRSRRNGRRGRRAGALHRGALPPKPKTPRKVGATPGH